MAMKVKEVVEIIPPQDIFVGNPQASVTLMEFGEYESEDCAKANEVVKKLLEEFDGKIKFSSSILTSSYNITCEDEIALIEGKSRKG